LTPADELICDPPRKNATAPVTAAADRWDTVIVGAGAAGLATAIFTRERNPARRVLLLDSAHRPGAKILVSGGARCNVTNSVVSEQDYWGGSPGFVRRVLRALPVRDTVAFFEQAGVPLHEEADGKLFPDSNRARDVLDALLSRASATGVDLRAAHRVTAIGGQAGGFLVETTAGAFRSRTVVLATGGQALPKSGSDGAGYGFARALGHTVVPTTPALAPLVLDSARDRTHETISGVALETELALWVDGTVALRLRGPLLWTHFGISGPVVLNVSRHWLRAQLEGRRAELTASFVPRRTFQAIEKYWMDEAVTRPRSSAGSALARLVPASMAAAMLGRVAVDSAAPLAHLGREPRRLLTRALTEWPLPVVDSRGYTYAEATAGGIDVREVDPGTMASRVCPGLYVVGEVLDVDGRLGGFNFQWAWSSAFAAGNAIGGV
jgi:predicted Rossmann fold flavoprotein